MRQIEASSRKISSRVEAFTVTLAPLPHRGCVAVHRGGNFQRKTAPRRPGCDFVHHHVTTPVQLDINPEKRCCGGDWLDSVNAAHGPDELRGNQRVVTDVGSNIDENSLLPQAGPDERVHVALATREQVVEVIRATPYSGNPQPFNLKKKIPFSTSLGLSAAPEMA